MRQSERGNAVIMILIGVALFAALAATFMRGSQQGQGNLTNQQAKIAAQEIINYGIKVQRGVDKLRQKGCSETDFSFENTVLKMYNGNVIYHNGHNPNAPPTGECDLFKTAGAGLTAQLFESATVLSSTMPPTYTGRGSSGFATAIIPNVGNNTKDELLLSLPYVREDVCVKINELLGIPNHTTGRPPYAEWTTSPYNAPFFPATESIVDTENVIRGKNAFCVRYNGSTSATSNGFFQVLIAR